jgi:hypothetical protein
MRFKIGQEICLRHHLALCVQLCVSFAFVLLKQLAKYTKLCMSFMLLAAF